MPPSDAGFIILLPEFSEIDNAAVSEVRRQHDHLHEKIPPHITIVYPQSLYSPAQLDGFLCAALADVKQQEFYMDQIITKHEETESYIFLSTTNAEAMDFITSMHENLYKNGNLKSTLQNNAYKVHMTIGRFKDSTSADDAYKMIRPQFTPVKARITHAAVISRKNGERLIFSKHALGH